MTNVRQRWWVVPVESFYQQISDQCFTWALLPQQQLSLQTHTSLKYLTAFCSCLTCSCKTWAGEFSHHCAACSLCHSTHIPNIMSVSLVSFCLSAYETSKMSSEKIGFPLNQQVNKTKIWQQNFKRQLRLQRLHQFFCPPSSYGIIICWSMIPSNYFPLIIYFLVLFLCH